ncbi:MAG TPA: MoaD/ThiS family protein [Bdellovibrionota bacterium]|nr:MoaD/ThiS family protein [Bdellovibrionota bacterium]
MNDMIAIRLQLFGAIRHFFDHRELSIKLPINSRVSDLRSHLKAISQNHASHQKMQEVISSSVFADDRSVLKESDQINPKNSLAILPPVCGG